MTKERNDRVRLTDTIKPVTIPDAYVARFWARVDKGESGCWTWTGHFNGCGYGLFYAAGETYRAHRAAWLIVNGEQPSDVLDHLCKNKACVNPAHLEPVTQGENSKRHASGITHCPRGHEYTDENTVMRPTRSGGESRNCRTCIASRSRRLHDRIWQLETAMATVLSALGSGSGLNAAECEKIAAEAGEILCSDVANTRSTMRFRNVLPADRERLRVVVQCQDGGTDDV